MKRVKRGRSGYCGRLDAHENEPTCAQIEWTHNLTDGSQFQRFFSAILGKFHIREPREKTVRTDSLVQGPQCPRRCLSPFGRTETNGVVVPAG
jgi:hypothetical protein